MADGPDLLISVSRQRPDGDVEYVAHSADPAVVEATLDALERVLRGPARRPLLSLSPTQKRERRPAEAANAGGGAPDAAGAPFQT